MQKYTDVIFDFDGTLVDSAPAILATFARILQRRGIEPAVPLSERLIGPPLPATLRTIAEGANDALIEELTRDFRESYDTEGIYSTTVYPGVEEMLRALHGGGKKLFVATNKRARPTHILLEHLAWTSLFHAVYCCDSQSPAYTSKDEMLRDLVAAESISRTTSIFVGDTAADGKAANSNKITFLAATWGYGGWEATKRADFHPAWQAVETAAAVTEFAGCSTIGGYRPRDHDAP